MTDEQERTRETFEIAIVMIAMFVLGCYVARWVFR
jgi:hypothetical protein